MASSSFSYSCAFSSLRVSIPSSSLSLNPRKAGPLVHPIFQAAPEAVWPLASLAGSNSLPLEDLHLLTLASLLSSGVVSFRGPVLLNPPSLAQWALRTIRVSHSIFLSNSPSSFPQIILSSEAGASEDNLKYVCEVLEESLNSYKAGRRGEARADDVSRREEALERLVRNPHKDPSSYAPQLANWAAVAGSFPTFMLVDPSGASRTCADYWKELIVHCTKSAKIMKLCEKDLAELENHCLENIEAGSLFSHRLFQILSNARTKIGSQWDFGDIDDLPPAPMKTFQILSGISQGKSEGKTIVMSALAQDRPKKENFPDLISWLRADLRWKLANGV
jgi:hypothetical protein